ncbi:hypothetical protein DNTS_013757 [Danionella cerebrum]|uniref:Uncharacterized protein n=1 Tax=Danionella cerebrum TaxID=2873325 RepID=A0A553REB3_9TELE|nr:hypothetical protein DNTS_013757 [Danionella translucida]
MKIHLSFLRHNADDLIQQNGLYEALKASQHVESAGALTMLRDQRSEMEERKSPEIKQNGSDLHCTQDLKESIAGNEERGLMGVQQGTEELGPQMETMADHSDDCDPVVTGCHSDPEIAALGDGGAEIADKMETVDLLFPPETLVDNKESNIRKTTDVEEDLAISFANFGMSTVDKSSDISEQGSNISRKSSFGIEGSVDLGCPSSQTDSRRSSLQSFCTEHRETEHQEFASISPEPSNEKVLDSPFTQDQVTPRKPDTLSKKDRYLIRKIRRYYEHAEHQDASFAVKRRESLSHIPAGLVRNLSQQLNGFTDEDMPFNRRRVSVSRPTLWSVFNLPSLEKSLENTDVENPTDGGGLESDEQFKNPSDMVNMWENMEIIGSCEEQSQLNTFVPEGKEDISKVSSDSGLGEPLLILEDSDESSPRSSPITEDLQPMEQKPIENRKVQHPPLPKIITLRCASEEEFILQDMEKMKNKVFHLARQYSQRIKRSRPVMKQRSKISESHFITKNLSSVMEERTQGKEKGVQDTALFLPLNEPVDLKSSSQPSDLCSSGSSPLPFLCRLYPPRPQSPVQTESFLWPDVKELCTKYSNHMQDDIVASSCLFPVIRSTSFPEKVLNNESKMSGVLRSLSCSSPLYRTTSTDLECSGKTLKGDPLPLLCRAEAFDFQVSEAFEEPESCKSKDLLLERTRDKSENESRPRVDVVLQSGGKEEFLGGWINSRGPPTALLGKSERGPRCLVKNLREKFQNLSLYT